MSNTYDANNVPESPMQKLARISMDQYTQQMFTEADASFAGTTSFYLVDPPPFTIPTAATVDGGKKISTNASSSSITEAVEYDDTDDLAESTSSTAAKRRKKSSSPSSTQEKQQQQALPMFLTKTFHMVGRCDPAVASWSEDGKSFTIKNVEKFASIVLPQYFKHCNFSSFARQLNFYGFRKLKAEPILTADYDSRTSNHMRFFHEQFQQNKPELLHNIKRATKDIQPKDEVYNLRVDIQNLNDTIAQMNSEFDMKISQVTMEFNRKLAHVAGLYDQLRSLLVQQGQQQQGLIQGSFQQHPQQPYIQQPLTFQLNPLTSQPALVPSSQVSSTMNNRVGILPLSIPSSASNHSFSAMQSLHQACMTLQSPAGPQPQHTVIATGNSTNLLVTTAHGNGTLLGMGTSNTSLSNLSKVEDGSFQQPSVDIPSDEFQLPPPRLT